MTGSQPSTAQRWEDQVRRPTGGIVIRMVALVLVVVLGFLVTLAWASVPIPLDQVVLILTGGEPVKSTWTIIVMDLRMPRALVAVLAGAALGVGGLQMQTLFRNPLADPFILGISAGASLGVAILVLAIGGAAGAVLAGTGVIAGLGVVGAAAMGAAAVLVLMLAVAARLRDNVVLLILGVVLAAFIEAFVSILVYFADPTRLRPFLSWGFGSFASVDREQLLVFAPVILASLAMALASTKQLNALLLGEAYARSMGLSVRQARLIVMGTASLMAGTVVAFCGPVAFLGIAVPHLARGLFGTADHRVLMPAVMLIGAALGVVCGLLAELPGRAETLPLNAATALIGAPVVFWVLLRSRRTGPGL